MLSIAGWSAGDTALFVVENRGANANFWGPRRVRTFDDDPTVAPLFAITAVCPTTGTTGLGAGTTALGTTAPATTAPGTTAPATTGPGTTAQATTAPATTAPATTGATGASVQTTGDQGSTGLSTTGPPTTTGVLTTTASVPTTALSTGMAAPIPTNVEQRDESSATLDSVILIVIVVAAVVCCLLLVGVLFLIRRRQSSSSSRGELESRGEAVPLSPSRYKCSEDKLNELRYGSELSAPIPSNGLSGDAVATLLSLDKLLVSDADTEGAAAAVAIGQFADPSDVETLGRALAALLESEGLGSHVFRCLVRREVSECEERSTLFRVNSLSAQVFRGIAMMHGLSYLSETLGVLVAELNAFAGDDGADGDEAKLDHDELGDWCQKVFSAILGSKKDIPAVRGFQMRSFCCRCAANPHPFAETPPAACRCL
jgi:hypothetical protein